MVGARVEDAFEIVVGGDGSSPLLLTCEHASNRVPPPRSWPEADERLRNLHWAYDLGAAEVTRGLAERLNAVAVLARFTRLLVDPNRSPESENLFRDRADGEAVWLNVETDEAERQARIQSLYEPFHAAIDGVMAGRPPGLLLSVHSFTPRYEGGDLRPMQLGVLFDFDREPALVLAAALAKTGLVTALNAPYSGLNGMMYSAQSHGTRHSWRALELEIRQDLSGDPEKVEGLVSTIADAVLAAQLV